MVIQLSTREAGVRNLVGAIGRVMRRVATQIVKKPSTRNVTVTTRKVRDFLGVHRFKYERIRKAYEEYREGLKSRT